MQGLMIKLWCKHEGYYFVKREQASKSSHGPWKATKGVESQWRMVETNTRDKEICDQKKSGVLGLYKTLSLFKIKI